MFPRLLLFFVSASPWKKRLQRADGSQLAGSSPDNKNGLIMKIDLHWAGRKRFARVCAEFEKGADELERIVTEALATDEASRRERLVSELRTRMERQETLLSELGTLHSEEDETALWLCRDRHEVIGAAVFRLEEM